MLQDVDVVEDPAQLLPPFFGEGLVHVLLAYFTPPPHVLLQLPYEPNELQPPFTVRMKKVE